MRGPSVVVAILAIVLAAALATAAHAQQCGWQAGGATCPNCLCCSRFGYCGSTSDYCGAGCQSQCSGCGPTPPGPSPGGGVSSIISRDLFEQFLLHRDRCQDVGGFYTYDAFLAAAAAFPAFGTTGSTETRKQEVVAFFGQTSHETTGVGGPPRPTVPTPGATASSGSWARRPTTASHPPSGRARKAGSTMAAAPSFFFFFFFEERRGPIMLAWNYNYGPAGRAIGVDLLNNPDLVATDATVSFKTALWFWMTPQANKPSPHAVITGQWTPTAADNAAGRVPGYGVITNIINGGLECGRVQDSRVADRIGFYQRYCNILGVGYGSNLDCYNQRPFVEGLLMIQQVTQ